jgi:hypothetical protein
MTARTALLTAVTAIALMATPVAAKPTPSDLTDAMTLGLPTDTPLLPSEPLVDSTDHEILITSLMLNIEPLIEDKILDDIYLS